MGTVTTGPDYETKILNVTDEFVGLHVEKKGSTVIEVRLIEQFCTSSALAHSINEGGGDTDTSKILTYYLVVRIVPVLAILCLCPVLGGICYAIGQTCATKPVKTANESQAAPQISGQNMPVQTYEQQVIQVSLDN